MVSSCVRTRRLKCARPMPTPRVSTRTLTAVRSTPTLRQVAACKALLDDERRFAARRLVAVLLGHDEHRGAPARLHRFAGDRVALAEYEQHDGPLLGGQTDRAHGKGAGVALHAFHPGDEL